MIIAIDGPSGTGKSSVAKCVAKKLGFTFFDTGAMYRALAWWVRQEGIDPSREEEIAKQLPSFHYEIKMDIRGEKRYFAGSTDVTEAIRTSEISSISSQIAAYPEVRHAMVAIQRNFGERGHAVFEGRDMGTVVFPNADLKIFLTARPEIRARRRYEELLLKFPEMEDSLQFDQILNEIEERDRNDSTRAASPLKQAPDAILIDTSALSLEEVVNSILALAMKKKRYSPMKLSYKIVYWMARIFFKVCFRLKIYGLEHFRTGSGILASNHASNFDPQVLSISCPEEVQFLAKEYLFRIPFLGRLIRILNSHPVSGTSTDVATFRKILELLHEGKKVILFPEGTRSIDGQLQPLERGMAFIAYKARCPIFPVYLDGTFAAWPRGKKLPRLFGRMRVVFGAPIEIEDVEGLDKKEAEKQLTERTEQSLRNLKTWLENGAQGIP